MRIGKVKIELQKDKPCLMFDIGEVIGGVEYRPELRQILKDFIMDNCIVWDIVSAGYTKDIPRSITFEETSGGLIVYSNSQMEETNNANFKAFTRYLNQKNDTMFPKYIAMHEHVTDYMQQLKPDLATTNPAEYARALRILHTDLVAKFPDKEMKKCIAIHMLKLIQKLDAHDPNYLELQKDLNKHMLELRLVADYQGAKYIQNEPPISKSYRHRNSFISKLASLTASPNAIKIEDDTLKSKTRSGFSYKNGDKIGTITLKVEDLPVLKNFIKEEYERLIRAELGPNFKVDGSTSAKLNEESLIVFSDLGFHLNAKTKSLTMYSLSGDLRNKERFDEHMKIIQEKVQKNFPAYLDENPAPDSERYSTRSTRLSTSSGSKNN